MRRQRIAGAGLLAAGLLAAPAPAQADEVWKIVPPAFTWGPNRHFADVEGDGAGGAWAVGFQREKYVGVEGGVTPGSPDLDFVDILPKPVLQRFDGSAWKNVVTPGLTGEGELQDVDTVSASNVWVTGYAHTAKRRGTTYLAHWDGTKWTPVEGPRPGVTAVRRHLSADAGGVWIAEDGKVSRRTGSTWTTYDLGRSVYELRSFGSGEAWAYGDPWLEPDNWVKHFDGTAWTDIPLPSDSLNIRFVASGPNTGWMATENGLALWNGSGWTTVPYPAEYPRPTVGAQYPTVDIDGPWISTPEGLLRWDGSAWTLLRQAGTDRPMPSMKDAENRVWGFAYAQHMKAYFPYRMVNGAWKLENVSQITGFPRLTPLSNGVLYSGEDRQGNLVAYLFAEN